MGRGRQKAKQQKIARKLKYMTTDTDYDELAKELGAHEPGTGSFDPFADVENDEFEAQDVDETVDDLDEYAKWASGYAHDRRDAGDSRATQTKAAQADSDASAGNLQTHRPAGVDPPVR